MRSGFPRCGVAMVLVAACVSAWAAPSYAFRMMTGDSETTRSGLEEVLQGEGQKRVLVVSQDEALIDEWKEKIERWQKAIEKYLERAAPDRNGEKTSGVEIPWLTGYRTGSKSVPEFSFYVAEAGNKTGWPAPGDAAFHAVILLEDKPDASTTDLIQWINSTFNSGAVGRATRIGVVHSAPEGLQAFDRYKVPDLYVEAIKNRELDRVNHSSLLDIHDGLDALLVSLLPAGLKEALQGEGQRNLSFEEMTALLRSGNPWSAAIYQQSPDGKETFFTLVHELMVMDSVAAAIQGTVAARWSDRLKSQRILFDVILRRMPASGKPDPNLLGPEEGIPRERSHARVVVKLVPPIVDPRSFISPTQLSKEGVLLTWDHLRALGSNFLGVSISPQAPGRKWFLQITLPPAGSDRGPADEQIFRALGVNLFQEGFPARPLRDSGQTRIGQPGVIVEIVERPEGGVILRPTGADPVELTAKSFGAGLEETPQAEERVDAILQRVVEQVKKGVVEKVDIVNGESRRSFTVRENSRPVFSSELRDWLVQAVRSLGIGESPMVHIENRTFQVTVFNRPGNPALPATGLEEWQKLRLFSPEVFDLLMKETNRLAEDLDLIASETFPPLVVLTSLAHPVGQKYAEGYPGNRYYEGAENVDKLERYAKQQWLKAAEHLYQGKEASIYDEYDVNLQAHAGSSANQAIYFAVLNPSDAVSGLDLPMGGHLTHGFRWNFSGRIYKSIPFGVNVDTGEIDYDALEASLLKLAPENRPRLMIVGGTAYIRQIQWKRLRQIADRVTLANEAVSKPAPLLLAADVAHNSPQIFIGDYPSPFGYAHFIMLTNHKSAGPRGAVLYAQKKAYPEVNKHIGLPQGKNGETWENTTLADLIDRAIIPGLQGGPKMNEIAAKAVHAEWINGADVSVLADGTPTFREYAGYIGPNAKALAAALKDRGVKLVGGGTDVHLMLVDVRPFGLMGNEAAKRLNQAGIVTNANSIPVDPGKEQALDSSLRQSGRRAAGIRLGVNAMTYQGMREKEMGEVADLVVQGLQAATPEQQTAVRQKVRSLTGRFPIYRGFQAMLHRVDETVRAKQIAIPEKSAQTQAIEEWMERMSSAGLEEKIGVVAVGGTVLGIPGTWPQEDAFAVTVGLAQTEAAIRLSTLPPTRFVVAAGQEEVEKVAALGVPKDQILPTKEQAIWLARELLRAIRGLRVQVLETTARTLGELKVWMAGLPPAWQGAMAGLEEGILKLQDLSQVGV